MEARKKWYQKTFWIIIALLLFFPAGLFLMFKYAKWNNLIKLGVLILLVIIFAKYSEYSSGVTAPSKETQAIQKAEQELKKDTEKRQGEEEKIRQEVQQRKAKEEEQKQRIQELGDVFCAQRSKPNMRYVNLDDFIAMYEAKGETVTLRPVINIKPQTNKCEQIMETCFKLWDDKDCQRIAEGKIWIDMSEDQLILSWGLPDDRNNSVYSFGTHSQWVYDSFGPYVYLQGKDSSDMKVTSWQN